MSKEENTLGSTRNLTVVGLMSAVTIVMAYTPLGMIPLPGISLTISHIPTIITAILFGPVMGGIVGFVFGMVTLLRAATSPMGALDPLFMNPAVSILPRVLVAVSAYYVYKLFAKFNSNVGLLIAAAAGSLTNTIGCLGMIYLIYAKALLEKLQAVEQFSSMSAEAFIWMIISTSGLLEMAAAVIITFPIVKALKKVFSI